MAGGAETSHIAAPLAIARHRRANTDFPVPVTLGKKSYFALNGASECHGIRL